MLEIVIEVDGTKVKATAFGSRMERPAPQVIGDLADLELFGKKVGRAVKTGKPLDAQVVEDAQRLHEALFAGEIRDIVTRIRAESPDSGVLVRLLVRNRAMQSIPWEAFCQPGTSEGFLAAGTRIDLARGVSSSEPTTPHSVQGAIRLLPIAPTGDAGVANLKGALESAIGAGKLAWLDPVTGEQASPRKLLQRLRTAEPAHVIHFIGHGGVDVDGHPTLRLADDEYGDEVWVKVEILAGELAAGFGKELRLVVLEACEGASPGLLGSAAEILARAGAQAVIAYLWPVRAEVSRTCSEEFYRALLTADRGRGDVAKSLSAARRTLLLESAAGFSPVLYVRGADPVLFDFGAAPARVPTIAPAVAVETSRFFVPFKKNPHFVGRDVEAHRLHELLQTDQASGTNMVALSGMGGIGKTLIAAEYAHQYRDAYPDGVYWVNAAQDWQIELGRLGKLAGCRPGEGPAEQEHVRFARAFADTLRANPRALVIFDNVDNPLELQDASLDLVPARLDCKLVVTTRRRELPAAEIFVSVLAEDPSLDLLLTKSRRRDAFDQMPDDERTAARLICKILGGHPLAIALAGAYLEKHGRISFAGYLEGLQTEGALAVMDATRIDARLLATQHEGNVGATLNVQWKSIQGDGARLALQTAALLTESAVISRPLLSLLTDLSDEPRSWRETPLEEALRELSSLSLLEEFGPKSIKLHRLLRELIEKQIPERDVFAADRASSLLEALWNVKTLEREVANRGIIDVLADLNIARGLAKPSDVERLNMLVRPLDREAHSLQNWNKEKQPAFFLQQLHNQALELGIDIVQQRMRTTLDAAKVPWFRQCFPTSGESRALVRTLDGHLGGCHGIALSADGRTAISAGVDKTVKMWDWETGRLLRTFTGHTREVNGVAMTPDGRRIVSGSDDRSVRVWDAETGQLLQSLEGHTNGINRVCTTSDGRFGISASKDGTLRVWDLNGGEAIRMVERPTGITVAAVYQVYSATDVVVTSDGKFAIAASQDCKVVVWDVATWRIVRTFSGHTGPVWSVAASIDGRHVVSASEDGTIKCWDLATGALTRTISDNDSNVLAVALTSDQRFVVGGFRNGTIKAWDVLTGNLVHTFRGHSHSVIDIVTTLDGRNAISVSTDGTIRVWDLDVASDARRDEGHVGGIYDTAFLPDGKFFVTASLDRTIKMHDVATGGIVRTLRGHEQGVFSIAVAPDGRSLVSGSDDKTVRVWDIESGQVVHTFEGHTDLVRGVAVTPDGRRVVSSSYDCTVRVWDLATGLIMNVFEGHSLAVRDVVVTPDGRYAISASFDKTLKVWDIELGLLAHTLEGHIAAVWTLALTPDGRFVVSGAQDYTLKVWEVATGQLVRTLEGHKGMVLGVALTADGRTVISTSGDMSVKAWDILTGQEILTLESSWPLSCCAISSTESMAAIGTSIGGVLVLAWHAFGSITDKRDRRTLDHLLTEGDLIGQAALDVLLCVPSARLLFEQGGPDECDAGLLVVQTLGRASPAIEMAAAHFEVHQNASFVDYVDALGLEGMLGTTGVSTDESFWTAERIDAVRDAAFDVSWRAMTDSDARMVLCTAAIFGSDVPPTAATLSLFTGLVGESDIDPYARIEATLGEIARRGWLETKLGLREVLLRPYVQRFILKLFGDWAPFAKARVDTFIAVFSDIEKMEREVARRGIPAVTGDLRIGALMAITAGKADVLATRWRVFTRETHSLIPWDPRAVPAFFLQQMRNRALDMGEDAMRIECETVLARRNHPWLKERFPVARESAALIRTYRGHAAEVRCVVFRIDKDRVQFLSGSDDRTVRLWDSVTGLVISVFEGHSKPVTDLAITADGRFVASASEDGTIHKWDVWTGQLVRVFNGHTSAVRRVAIEGRGRYMLSAAVDNTIRVWDFDNGNVGQVIGDQGDPVTWVSMSNDGQRAVYGSPSGPIAVQQFTDQKWTQVYTLEGHNGRVNDVVMMSDARSALSAADDGTIKLWDIENGRLIRSFEGHTAPVMRVVPSGDDRYAVSVSQDKTVRVWDIAEGKEMSRMRGHTDVISGLDVHWPLGIAVTASSDATLRLWARGGALPEAPIIGHTAPVFGVTTTPDGKYAVSAAQDNTVCVWEISTGKLLRTLERHGDIAVGVTVAPDGQTILTACDDGKVRIWDFATGRLLREVDHGAPRVRAVVVTQDGRTAISACHDKLLRVWDLATGQVIRLLEGHTERVRAVALTPDGRYAISGSFDQSLRVWDWATGKTVRVLQGHTSAIWSVAVTPDGRFAISASFDRTLRVWELATGRLVRTLEGHSDWVVGVAVAPNGHRVISTSQDATLVMWDLPTGKRVGALAANAAIYCLTLTPDGKVIVIGDGAGAVRFLDIVE